MKLWTIGMLIACGAIATVAHAQTGNASISGQINDPSGAVIPGAQVSVRNVATNVTHTTQSSADGRFSVTSLIPGEYTLTASFQGFRTAERDGLVLRVGDRIALAIALEVGSATDRVTVTAEVPLIRTEDAQAGLVIENRRIQDLPQYNRDPLAFVFLTPNVSGSNQGDLRINGSRSKQIEYFIDGVPVTTGYLHDVPPSVPSREAIAEFKVITNGLSAEYGRLSGGAVQVVSRSGTNQYHGSVYEFFRNDKLNASDWNTNRFGRKKGVFHDNVFGGTFGGPVSIPKLYNGRDRTFFFLNYEGTRRRTGNNVALGSVPTELERQGDFSQSVLDGGTSVQIFDPLTSRIDGARVRRDPFPANRIPQSRFDALASIYMGYYPQPNRPPLPGSNNEGNFIGSVSNPADNNRWTGRVDQNWSVRHSTHGTVSYFDSNSGNNSDLEYTSVVRSADIAVSITESADPVTAGSGTQNLVYTVTAKNLGPSNASGLTLAISPTLPSGVSVSGIVCSGTTSYSAGTWTIGTLTRNASVTLTGTLTVGSSALSGTDVVNLQAQVSNLNEADPNPGNDADIEATSVVRSVDLAVGVSDSADPTALTDSPVVLVYTLTVSNLGPSSASGVALDVATTLPAGVTVGSSLAGGGSTFDGSTWTVGNLASGASQTLAITLSLAPAVKPGTDVVSLQAQVTGVNEPDSNVGNDVASEATSVVHSVDLAVEVAESADPVVLGAASVELVYTVTVSNLGPFDASGVSLDIATTLPSKSVLNSSVPSGSTSFDGSTWNVGAIASASSETLALHITVAADEVAGADVISVQASVAAVAEHDAVSENDSSSEATSVVHLADLVLTKDDDGLLAAPDKVTVYAIAVLNQGPNSADGVVITETVPAGTVYWAAESDAGWNVTGGGVAGDTCTFNVGSLSVGASKEVAFAVKVVNPLSGVSVEIENTATVDSASNEANPGDELDTVNTFLVPNPIDDIDGDDIPNAEDPDDDGDGIPDTKDPDRDGDGIDNLLDPNLDDPTEVGPTGIPGLEGMTWSKALGTLNFVAPGKDSFKASGVLLLPAAFVLEGATAEVDIGGEMRSFLLSDKGKGESGSDKIKVKIKPTKPVSSQVNAKVVLGLSKGDLVMGDIDGVPFDGSTLGTAARDLQLVLTLDDGNLAPQSRYNQKRVEYKVTDKKGVLKSLKP
ncbi:MAG: DUF11 domain-containing protein, partial [Bryobacteraceae bacterium]|nr:DUF11 domain-containing protein [Bryobacteraceae bacterium]